MTSVARPAELLQRAVPPEPGQGENCSARMGVDLQCNLHDGYLRNCARMVRDVQCASGERIAEVAASPCGIHLAQVRQVGEGVSPSLDADANIRIPATGCERGPRPGLNCAQRR